MDTIKIYLDNMFLTLPETPETIRAKEELYSMMEDKYMELKAAGKTENEAVGTVIAEFGNLEELAETLHLKAENTGSNSYDDIYTGYNHAETLRQVSSDEADDFLFFSRKSALQVALGVMLCIFSPITLIFLGGLSDSPDSLLKENVAALCGLVALFLLVAIAVGLFIAYGLQEKNYEYLKAGNFRMDFGTTSYIKELSSQFRTAFAVEITIGVVLCILSPVPLLVSSLLFDTNNMLILGCVCALLLIVGIAVFLLVHAGMMHASFQILLQEGDYAPKKKHRESTVANSLLNTLIGEYWTLITVIYFGISFLFNNWHISWLIWILAAVFYTPFCTIVGALRRRK